VSESPLTRLHLALRWRSCPFREIAAWVPLAGRILDAGCGHGLFALYLALTGPERRVTAVDIDDAKLAVARRAAITAGVDDRVGFELVPPDWRPEGSWDAVVEVDMLYLLGRARAKEWIGCASGALAPGGRLVVKELDVVPAWKARGSELQEVLATRVLQITEGEALELIACDDVADAMRAAGLAVDVRRLDRGRLHPHYVAVGGRR
jgi:cyclopropane fatty-acyl-phospholipid synthase-like methyltransferase